MNTLPSKVFLLLKQAEDDYKNGYYDKAISAAYFSCRMASEYLLKKLNAPIPRRDDKLANAIGNIVRKEITNMLKRLYYYRIHADYSENPSPMEIAQESLNLATYIISSIEKFLHEL
ncbi:MAG: HEPN domain-containing protein [Thermoprotei archaeon]|jgi:uncharacterized protein (UPF0332 family)